ncbi:hypothetical protein ACFL4U_02590 [Candidatus Neomarinimicrobiota bacterium]
MNSSVKYLIAVVMMPLIACPILMAQELNVAWDGYLSTDASLKSAVGSEQTWLEQQDRLQAEIRDLQKNQAWYNGWIIEYLLSRKSAQQLGLADSLLQVRGRIRNLQQQKELAFQVLKQVYEDMLLSDDVQASLSASQKEQAVTLGQWLLTRSESHLDLPDYTAILTEQYENEAIKDMVFHDLQVVLRTKLESIDALVTEKQQEITLLNRLNEFHRDLSIQIESDRDLRGDTESNQAYIVGPQDILDEDIDDAFFSGKESEATRYTTIEDQDYLSAVRQNISKGEGEDISLNPDPLYDELQRLTSISQQYQVLLQRLETDLPD